MKIQNKLVGKIACLPADIREQLNRRLKDSQPASVILPWLNTLPPVQEILATQFGGKPISPQNLSNWRAIGFERWLKDQENLTLATPQGKAISEFNSLEPGDKQLFLADWYLQLFSDKTASFIANAPISEVEKIDRMGRHIFGDSWHPSLTPPCDTSKN